MLWMDLNFEREFASFDCDVVVNHPPATSFAHACRVWREINADGIIAGTITPYWCARRSAVVQRPQLAGRVLSRIDTGRWRTGASDAHTPFSDEITTAVVLRGVAQS